MSGEVQNEDSGIRMTDLSYVCRICEASKTVYVSPDMDEDGIPVLKIHGKHKLYRGYCDECDVDDRVFVAELSMMSQFNPVKGKD